MDILSLLPWVAASWTIAALIVFILTRNIKTRIKGMMYDAMDLVLSFLDNFLGGLGAVGLDIGDWLAAFMIYRHEKHIFGKATATFIAWEATNFFPISLIPILGEVVETITGLIPTDFILRLTPLNKFPAAIKKEKKLDRDVKTAKKYDVKTGDAENKLKQVKTDLDKERPIPALHTAKDADKHLVEELKKFVNSKLDNLNNLIDQIGRSELEAPNFLVKFLVDGISLAQKEMKDCKQAEDKEDFDRAITCVNKAIEILEETVNKFNNALDEYWSEQDQAA